jgi:hypothetical protein
VIVAPVPATPLLTVAIAAFKKSMEDLIRIGGYKPLFHHGDEIERGGIRSRHRLLHYVGEEALFLA